ncbi:metallophosphoesterase [Halovenus rubra]|uniref:Metallophosphoesterase n=2 Tax=Halovenus rubra TaxID=869890 RepID=A0ABD5X5P5_9EURY|nr:metallophosphoesterase [Halovenus rubra]
MATERAEDVRTEAKPPNDKFVRPTGSWGTESAFSDAEFSERVANYHWRFDADAYENVYVVGDVHGCLSELRTLWDRLDPTHDEMVVFVGDLIRKGPASTGVVEFVDDQPNAVSVRGNNEAKVLNGSVDPEAFEPAVESIESMPLVVSWGDSMAVHGGVDTRRDLSDQTPTDLLESRAIPPENGYDGPFWFEQYDGPGRIFFGHTVVESPFISDGAIGLDTGLVYGGELTAYDCKAETLVSVSAERTYQKRPAEKFLSF